MLDKRVTVTCTQRIQMNIPDGHLVSIGMLQKMSSQGEIYGSNMTPAYRWYICCVPFI